MWYTVFILHEEVTPTAFTDDVKLITYSPRVDRWNTATHAPGALAALAGMVLLLKKTLPGGSKTAVFCAVVYSLAFFCVYFTSAVYHALPPGEAKRRARFFDHLAIPLLLAGTTTPCALISLGRVSRTHGYIVFGIAWFCALFGVVGKTLFFEKMKSAVMAVYIIGGAVMLLSTLPVAKSFEPTAFMLLFIGSGAYILGALVCRMGIKRPCLHPVFHLIVLAGSLIHFYVIYAYIL